MHTPAWGGIEFDLYYSYMVPLYIMKGRLRKLHSLYETQMSYLSINKQPTEAKEDPYIPLLNFLIKSSYQSILYYFTVHTKNNLQKVQKDHILDFLSITKSRNGPVRHFDNGCYNT